MSLSELSLEKKTIVMFMMGLILIGGIWAYKNLGKLEDPEYTIKTAMVVTPYPGASPHEVEQQVTRIIEEAVQTSDEIEHVRSLSRAGISIVYVDIYEYNRTAVIQQIWDMLRRKVQSCQKNLPMGAGPSAVYDDYNNVYGIFLALNGKGYSNAELKSHAEYIKRELMLVQDVDEVELFGIRTECIYIEISRAKCASLGIPPGKIAETVNLQNLVVDAGVMKQGDRQIRMTAVGTIDTLREIENLMIKGKGDEQVLLKDLAEIKRGYTSPAEPMMRFNGEPAVGIAIAAVSGANVVVMGDAVQERIDEITYQLPVGLSLAGIYYQSRFVKSAIQQFMTNLGQSIAIVLAVLLVTMGLRSGLIIAANLILTILFTFVVMLLWNIDLQKISLAALILAMGMIVDNAIVVLDGTIVRFQQGEDKKSAIIRAATRTIWPLLGATIIACLAFFPIYMAPTASGEFCSSLFQVVIIALLTSWLLSMTQTPVFSHYFLTVPKSKKGSDLYSGISFRIYRKVLEWTLSHRIITLLILIALLGLSIFGFKYVPKIFFADSDKAQFFIDYRRPEGTGIETVSRDLMLVEKHMKSMPEVVNFTSVMGQGPPRFATTITPEPKTDCFGQIIVNVKNYREIDRLIKELEIWFSENMPDGQPHMWKYISGPKSDYRVEARFIGPDPATLRVLAEKAKSIMRRNPAAKSICDDWREPILLWKARYSQQKARMAGVERNNLAESLMSANDGLTIAMFREHKDQIPIKLKYVDHSPTDLSSLPVWGSGPMGVPLGQVIEKSRIRWEDPIVRRYDRRRVIRAQCDPIQGVSADELLNHIRGKIEDIPLPEGYSLEWEGEYEMSEEGNKGVQAFLPVSLLFMVMILVVLFNALGQPLIIILTIPLAMIGMTAGLLIFGQPFGFMALLGAYSLIGMMIKNAVVLIGQIDMEIQSGKKPYQAVKDASVSRMRPVLMASLTTIFGMIPLITDAMFVSMAVTIMFGLAFATILTLIFVPVLYTLIFRVTPETRSSNKITHKTKHEEYHTLNNKKKGDYYV